MNTALLRVKNLSIDFVMEDEVVHAIQHISFDIEQGHTLALVGESGSGKSVSALSIMGLLAQPPAFIKSGMIEFSTIDGQKVDLLKCKPEELEALRGSKIGMIFQEPMTSLNPLMKCGKQVAETIKLHKKISLKEAELETLKLFEEVKLPDPAAIISRYPHELSGGQKQRVMIAIAICCDPSLLIADEPTTALDVTVQKTILDLLKDLQKQRGMAILFITHDLGLVKSFADEVLIMLKGKSVEYGLTETIFSNPKESYTKGLLNCRPSNHQRVKFLNTINALVNNESIFSEKENLINELSYQHRLESLSVKPCILELKHLDIWYPMQRVFMGRVSAWFKAVNDVNLSIKEGETMGLVGESGCGKTTIGKAIVQLVKPTQGEIIYRGRNIADFSKSDLVDYRKEVQIIFQDPYSSLNPRIPIGHAIMEPMTVHSLNQSHERKEKVNELLSKVGLLPEHFVRYPHEFSGGQRQRICIARALALKPKFIICDESVSALDISVQAQVLNLLVSLRDEFNLSYLFISHDLGVVKHMSDRIAVMQKGSIMELNHAEAIYHHPQNTYTKELIQSSL